MIHDMTLNSPWFELIRDGIKLYEGRRKTAKIMAISPNDIIEFRHHTNQSFDPIRVIVENIIEFPTFKDALTSLPIQEILPIPNITIEEGIEIYKTFVSLQTQYRDGVVMIKIQTIPIKCTKSNEVI